MLFLRCVGFDADVTPPAEGGPPSTDAPLADTGPAPTDGSSTDGALADASMCKADLTKDRRHCGRCGHDCLGGMCVASVCQPYTLDNGFAYATAITTEGTSALWTSGNSPGRVSRAGCGNAPTRVSALPKVRYIRTSGNNVYFADDANLYRCAGPTCANPVVVATGLGITGFAIDATSIYWTNLFELYACDKASCTTTTRKLLTTPYSSTRVFYRLALGAGKVFAGHNLNDEGGGTIISCPIASNANCNPTVVAKGLDAMFGFAADDSGVYFTDIGTAAATLSDGFLAWCPPAGCTDGKPQVLASPLTNANNVTVDKQAIYFTLSGGEGPPRVLAKP